MILSARLTVFVLEIVFLRFRQVEMDMCENSDPLTARTMLGRVDQKKSCKFL